MTTTTRTNLLAEAEQLIRRCGYSAFSYADLTNKIGITKASIHYHFPTKQGLMEAVVAQAMMRFSTALSLIEQEDTDSLKRLAAYSQLFLDGFDDRLRPFCCALSSEVVVLPEPIQKRTQEYFDIHIDWLTGVVAAGLGCGELRWDGTAQELAQLILSTLEGGSLVARAQKNQDLLFAGFQQVMRLISPEAPASAESP